MLERSELANNLNMPRVHGWGKACKEKLFVY